MSPVGDSHVDHPAVQRLSDDDRALAEDVLSRLELAVEPLQRLFRDGQAVALRALVRAHVEAAEAVACDEAASFAGLWRGEAGDATSHFVSMILDDDGPQTTLAPSDFPSFFRALISGEVVRPRFPVHPRLFIWGPLEARLQQADLMVLGGLNDGKWPRLADPDPWINRPMREQIGLPAPERRIGSAAHDFCQLVAAPRVYLTRAAKVDGVPTVPSRWLMRLEAVLKGVGQEARMREAFSPRSRVAPVGGVPRYDCCTQSCFGTSTETAGFGATATDERDAD